MELRSDDDVFFEIEDEPDLEISSAFPRADAAEERAANAAACAEYCDSFPTAPPNAWSSSIFSKMSDRLSLAALIFTVFFAGLNFGML